MSNTALDDIMAKRIKSAQKSGFKVLESHGCEATGGGVVLGERNWGRTEVKALFFKPRAHRNPFREEVVTSAHEKLALPGRVTKILQEIKDAKVAPHDLKVGEIIACVSGVTMQSAKFYKVVGIPHPRKVSLAKLENRMVSGDWMSGLVEPVDVDLDATAACGTFAVDMSSGEPRIKTGSSIDRMSRWSGRPVDIYCD